MNQFDRRHYVFSREWRGAGRERMPMRKTLSMRQQEPPDNFVKHFGWLLSGVTIAYVLLVVFWMVWR